MKKTETPNIDCPIELFPKQEEEITRLTQAVNGAPTAAQKLPYAESLVETVNVLLACEAYAETSLDCQLCRQISALRHQTFSLVIKAGQLDLRRRGSTP